MFHLSFLITSYLNGFKCFLDKLIILTGELLEICIVELRVRVTLWTNVPGMISFIKYAKEIKSQCMYLLLNVLRFGLQHPNAPAMKPVLTILTSDVKPKLYDDGSI